MATAEPTFISSPWLVDDRLQGHIVTAESAILANGNIIVVWSAYGDPPNTTGFDVFGAIFTPDGARVSDVFAVNTSTDKNEAYPKVVALNGGGFVVTWESNEGRRLDNHAIFQQVFDAAGNPIGNETQVDSYRWGRPTQPEILPLADGGYLTVWNYDEFRYNFQRFDADGNKVGGEERLPQLQAPLVFDYFAESRIQLIELDDGTIAAGIRGDVSIFELDGTLVEFRDGGPMPTADGLRLDLSRVPDGNGGEQYAVQVIDKEGTVVVPDFIIPGVNAARASVEALIRLPDGGFLFVWRAYLDGFMYMQVLDSAGTAIAPEPIRLSHIRTEPYSLEVLLLEGARVFVTYESPNIGSSGIETYALTLDLIQLLATSLTMGDDSHIGGSGNDIVDGLEGNDTISGETGNDTLIGGAGDDSLSGGAGDDSIEGGEGHDTIGGQSGADNLDGGIGHDKVLGGAGDDSLKGSWGYDTLGGGDGDDLLLGGGLDDLLFGGANDDSLWGGWGNDSLWGDEGDDALGGSAGNDLLGGGSGNDTIWSGSGNDTAIGGSGRDFISGGSGADSLLGGRAQDTIWAGTGNDFVDGGQHNDVIGGNLGNDTVHAGSGNDTVWGGFGDDEIDAETGWDRVVGGTGDDLLTGGLGSDIFVFFEGDGNDTITDFDATDDNEKIDLSGVSSITGFNEIQSSAVQIGDDVLILYGTGSLTLQNVDLNDLGANDFLF